MCQLPIVCILNVFRFRGSGVFQRDAVPMFFFVLQKYYILKMERLENELKNNIRTL